MAGNYEFGQGAPGGFGTLGSPYAANPGRDGIAAAIMHNQMLSGSAQQQAQQAQLPGMGPPGATSPGVTPGSQALGQSPLGMGTPGTPAAMPGGGMLPSLLPQQTAMAPPMPGTPRPY